MVSEISAAKAIIMIDVIDDGNVQYLVLVQIDERDLPLFAWRFEKAKTSNPSSANVSLVVFIVVVEKETSLKN